MSSFISSCFNKTSSAAAAPLVEHQPQPSVRCNWATAKKTAIVSGKIFLGLVMAVVIAAIVYDNYDCLKEPSKISRDNGCKIILGGDSLLLLFISCMTALYCRRRCRYQHYSSHQGAWGKTVKRYEGLYHAWIRDEAMVKSCLEKCFRSIETQGLLKAWLEIKGYRDIEAAWKPTRERISGGFCYGYTFALLNLMATHYNESSETLYEVLEEKKEDIYFYQFWQNVISDLLKSKDPAIKRLAYILPEKGIVEESTQKESEAGRPDSIHSFSFHDYTLIGLDLTFMRWMHKCNARALNFNHTLMIQGDIINVSSKAEEIESYLRKLIETLGTGIVNKDVVCFNPSPANKPLDMSQYTIVGIIKLHTKEPSAKTEAESKTHHEMQEKEKDEKERNAIQTKSKGHSLFFQYSDRYRFHDSGNLELPGFFEFSSADPFFKGLTQQLKLWKNVEYENLMVTLYAIPKAKDQRIQIQVSLQS